MLSTTATTVKAAADLVIVGDLHPPQSVVEADVDDVKLEPTSACRGAWRPTLTLPNDGGRVDVHSFGEDMSEVVDGDIRIVRNPAIQTLMVDGYGVVTASFFAATTCGGQQLSPPGSQQPWTCDFCGRIFKNRNFQARLCAAAAHVVLTNFRRRSSQP